MSAVHDLATPLRQGGTSEVRLTAAAWVGLIGLFALTALDAWGEAALWENGHWTLCATGAAALALLAYRRAPADERYARGAIAFGFGLYLVGQLAWDLQAALNIVTVPAGSDLFYLPSALPIAWGLVSLLARTLTGAEKAAFAVDAALVLATLVLLMWVAFGASALLADNPLAGTIVILYPTAFLGGSIIAALAALRVRVAAAWSGINLLLLGLGGTGVAWVVWLAQAVVELPAVGSPVNYLFSVTWLAAGVGAARLSFRRSTGVRITRVATLVETMFPMVAVVIAVAATILAEIFVPEPMRFAIHTASTAIALLALVRQSMLMVERQRLAERNSGQAEAERSAHAATEEALVAHRASEERYRRVVDVFARLGEQLSFAADEATLVRGGVAALRRLVSTEAGDLLLANASQDRLLIGTTWGTRTGTPGDAVDDLQPLNCLGIRRGSLYHVADAADELILPCPAHPVEQGSLMCVPMLALGQIIGVVHLAADAVGAFDVDDERQAQRVAQQVALAIANARLVRTMESMALTDPLTRLHNARFFDPFLDLELATAQREGQPLGVVMIDLDHFKAFNDEHGHAAGDEALRVFARAALSVLRDSDTLARYGGEEFVVAARAAGPDETAAVAERLRAAVEGASVEVGPGRYARFTASFGVASTTLHGHDRLQLLKSADRALYRAKREGRNRVQVAGALRANRRSVATEMSPVRRRRAS